MNKHLFLIIAFFAMACKNNQPGYHLISHLEFYGFDNSSLRAAPKETKETEFDNLDDTTLNAKGKYKSYQLVRYNDKREMVYLKYCIDSECIIAVQSFYGNGLRREISHNVKDGSLVKSDIVTSRQLPDGRFEESDVSYSDTMVNWVTFTDSADWVIMKWVSDSSALQRYTGHTMEYKADRIQRIISVEKKGKTLSTGYLYDANNFLVQITASVNGKQASETIYSNNSYGDPIRSYTVNANGDTTDNFSFHYEYDKNGNWIKRLQTAVRPAADNHAIARGAGCSTTVREIKY